MTSTPSAARATALGRSLVLLVALAVLGAVGLFVTTSPPARAAGLTQVTGFGSNPGALAMYSYRPDGLPSGAPLVVELHGCTQNASTYFANSGWREMADRHGFALVLAQQSSSNNSSSCFNWFQASDTARGQGEALSIKQMTDYAVSSYGLDSSRVYVTGLSAGAAMTAVMVATYPDTYAGGSINAGLPYRCASSTLDAFSCMNPGVDQTPAAWGDLVRAASSGYTGKRPLVSIWQGTSDTTVAPMNAGELRDQFTNVAGLSQSPDEHRHRRLGRHLRGLRGAGAGHPRPGDDARHGRRPRDGHRAVRHGRCVLHRHLGVRRLPVRRLRLRDGLEPEPRPLQHVLHVDAQADLDGLLGEVLSDSGSAPAAG